MPTLESTRQRAHGALAKSEQIRASCVAQAHRIAEMALRHQAQLQASKPELAARVERATDDESRAVAQRAYLQCVQNLHRVEQAYQQARRQLVVLGEDAGPQSSDTTLSKAVPNTKGQIRYEAQGGKKHRMLGHRAILKPMSETSAQPEPEKPAWHKSFDKMPSFDSFDGLVERLKKSTATIYCRWSKRPDLEMFDPDKDQDDFKSTNWAGGGSENGVSVVTVWSPKWREWDEDDLRRHIARKLSIYNTDNNEPGERCWLMTGERGGTGSDNEPVLDSWSIKPLGVLSPDASREAKSVWLDETTSSPPA